MEKQTTQEYEKAIAYIIDRIKEGSLQLGSKLPPERRIAEELGIGRNSIREAISILHGMGLIDRVQGSGNYVSKHVGESIRQSLTVMLALGTITKEEIFEFRRVMEKAVCSNLIAKGLSYEYESILETKLEEMKLFEGKDLTDVDKEFHDTLIQATGNHLWAVLMEAVTDAYRDWINYVIELADESVRAKLLQCHADIYQNLVQKNEPAMLLAIDRHYDLIEQMV